MRSNTLIRICIGLLAGYLAPVGSNAAPEEPAMSLTLTSTAFSHQSSIPARYTCDGKDTSPPLTLARRAHRGAKPGAHCR